MASSVQRRLGELLLVVAVVVAGLGAEAAFSLVGLRYVPLRLQGDLPDDVRIFAQSSKSGVVPRDPVLLLGDSYAQGLGDWLLETNPNRNGPFHSAHVINRLSGRDVVAVGLAGAGSAEAMASLPAAAYAITRSAWRLRLPPPSVGVVYFYEGNDLNDNLRFLSGHVGRPDGADLAERIDRALTAYVVAPSVEKSWERHLPLLRFSQRLARRLTGELAAASSAPQPAQSDSAAAHTADPPNVVEVAGRAVELPPGLRSPAVELTEPELERAVLVFERSLAYLRRLLPGTPVLVAHLPSPLSSYRLLAPEVSIQRYDMARGSRYPKERVARNSDTICRLIGAASARQGAGFVDLRPAVRTAGTRAVLHGPHDFKHFNRPEWRRWGARLPSGSVGRSGRTHVARMSPRT